MKALFINILKNQTTSILLGLITSGGVIILNNLVGMSELFFTIISFLSVMIGIILIFLHPKWCKKAGEYLISLGMVITLFIIITTNYSIKKNIPNIEITTEDIIKRNITFSDSILWSYYEQDNPKLQSLIGILLLMEAEKNSSKQPSTQWILYADSLLRKSLMNNDAMAYYGMAYKKYHGLGCNKSISEAVMYAEKCIQIEEVVDAYILLKEMNLSKEEYPDVIKKVEIWEDSINEINNKVNQIMTKISLPDMAIDPQKIPQTSYYKIYDSIYRGDKSSLAWKIVHKYRDVMKRNNGYAGLVSAYYWGIGEKDSAHLYYDSMPGWGSLNVFFNYATDKDFYSYLRFSDVKTLYNNYLQTDNPILKLVYEEALYIKEQYFGDWNNNNDWTYILYGFTRRRNVFIEQLKPVIKRKEIHNDAVL